MMERAVRHEEQAGDRAIHVGEYAERIAEHIDRIRTDAKERAEREATQIVTEARHQSDRIIAQAHEDAQQISRQALAKAEAESAKYLTELQQKAELRVVELEEEGRRKGEAEAAETIAKAFDEAGPILDRARQAADEEAGKILANAKRDAEQLVREAASRGQKEARAKMLKEYEECARVMNEVKQRLEQAAKVAQQETGQESERPGEPTAPPSFAEEKVETGETAVEVKTGPVVTEENGTQYYRGEVELEITSHDNNGQIARFIEQLRKVRGTQLVSLGSFVQGRVSATIAAAQPLPLLRMIAGLPLVEDVVVQGDKIQVTLKTGHADDHS